METRKNRTPSARMIASKEDDALSKALPSILNKTANTIASQLSKLGESTSTPVSTVPTREVIDSPQEVIISPQELDSAEKDHTPIEEDIDVSNADADLDDSPSKVIEMHNLEMMKEDKIESVILNGAFPVANEVTISSMKFSTRPIQRKTAYDTPKNESYHSQTRPSNFTGETLNLKNSDLSVPNKAAHFLYFRCYDESEVQKEFPLTIDENRKGPQNFLVEPRVGLKNTDYYIDSYLWNRGKSTSSKKKIFVEIDGNHVKTSRRSIDTAHYLLNWYYSNMENRICKKVCWLENISDGNRASPVLVQYHVNYLSDMPIELRKTPKLYSDTRSVAQELLRSDSPMQTVQRFVETGETDPREIINKKQAYEMRRYVLSNARRKALGIGRKRDFEDGGLFYDDQDMFDDMQYDEYGEPMGPIRHRELTEARRIAGMACRYVGRNLENRISAMLDNRLGPQKTQHAELLSEWINTLDSVTAEDFDIAIHNVVGSMRKQLDELVGGVHTEFIEEPGTSGKRRIDDDAGTSSKQPRFEGEQYIFEGEEYVEEEVIAEDVVEEVVPSTSANGESSSEPKYDHADGSTFFFPPRGSTGQRDVSVDQ